MHKVGITGTGSLIGQGIIKSIVNDEQSSNYTLIGFDYFTDTVGSFWCDKNYILPDILKKGMESRWLEEVERIIKLEKLEIIFIGVDFELPLFSKYRMQLEEDTGCKIVVSDQRVIEISDNKYSTYQFLKDNDLYYPETFNPNECDIEKLEYPVIVKPRIGARSVGVSLVSSRVQLEPALKAAKDPIIQECVGDDSSEYTCGIIAFEGELKSSIVLNRTLKAGNTHISEYKDTTPQIIIDYIESITNKLKPYGACNFQLRLGKDGIPKMFEINARHSGTTYMRSLFGYNEVIYILKYLLEGKEIDFKLKEGKAVRYFEERLV